MNYYQLKCTCTRSTAEALAEFFHETDAVSVSLLDAADEPLFEPKPGEMPLWSEVQVLALFIDLASAEQAVFTLKQFCPEMVMSDIEIVEERDWVTETQNQFQPQCFGERLWVYPEWEKVPEAHEPALRLSPGLAFGTGTHPTTQMCIEALAKFLEPNESVVDFGCGSGILGLAALKMGASHVYAIDIDPQALEATHNNAILNEVDESRLWKGFFQDMPALQADVIVANILAQPLMELKAVFESLLKPQGTLIMAGLLNSQAEALVKFYAPWKALRVFAEKDEWICLAST